MDVRMPVMDGLEATRTIRALERPDAQTIPIIAMTANAFAEDVQRSLQSGMNAHLSKPVEPERLYETLDQMIHHRWEQFRCPCFEAPGKQPNGKPSPARGRLLDFLFLPVYSLMRLPGFGYLFSPFRHRFILFSL